MIIFSGLMIFGSHVTCHFRQHALLKRYNTLDHLRFDGLLLHFSWLKLGRLLCVKTANTSTTVFVFAVLDLGKNFIFVLCVKTANTSTSTCILCA